MVSNQQLPPCRQTSPPQAVPSQSATFLADKALLSSKAVSFQFTTSLRIHPENETGRPAIAPLGNRDRSGIPPAISITAFLMLFIKYSLC